MQERVKVSNFRMQKKLGKLELGPKNQNGQLLK
jgi:hypothetical protein